MHSSSTWHREYLYDANFGLTSAGEFVVWAAAAAGAGTGLFEANAHQWILSGAAFLSGLGLGTTIELVPSWVHSAQTAMLKRSARRLYERYLREAGKNSAKDVDGNWERWKFASLRLNKAAQESRDVKEEVQDNSFRLLNTATLLGSFGIEELPNGKSFHEVLNTGKKIEDTEIEELLSFTDRRLEQLSILERDLSVTRTDVQKTIGPKHEQWVTQLGNSQAHAVEQLLASSKLAKTHLENLRHLIAMTKQTQSLSNQAEIEAELNAYDQALRLEKGEK